MVIKVLDGHTSPETAFVVESYPYGRLRCQKRYWLETGEKGAGKGQVRCLSQTTNPKASNQFDATASKPKAGIYHDFGVLFMDENDHVHFDAVSFMTGWYENIKSFYDKYWNMMSAGQKDQFAKLYAIAEKIHNKYWTENGHYEEHGRMNLDVTANM